MKIDIGYAFLFKNNDGKWQITASWDTLEKVKEEHEWLEGADFDLTQCRLVRVFLDIPQNILEIENISGEIEFPELDDTF